jgi:hypothetical protein
MWDHFELFVYFQELPTPQTMAKVSAMTTTKNAKLWKWKYYTYMVEYMVNNKI